jgi:HD-GYP domain-containing protein (c-di-GMP phosphodiesterase class II)
VAQVRVVEVLAAVSLTTDLASGMPFEKGLQTCAVAASFARSLGLDRDASDVVFHTALLRSIGCTAHASENADEFGDDVRFQRALKELDVGDPVVFARQMGRFGDWAGSEQQPALAERFHRIAPTVGPRAVLAGCEVAHALAPRLGLPAEAATALDHVYERWDGHGNPGRVGGSDLSLAMRVVHVCEQAVLAYHEAGPAGAVQEVARRSGGHLDPDLVAAFRSDAEAHLTPLRDDALAAVVRAEPRTLTSVRADGLVELSRALSVLVDLKGRFLLGHSTHVAGLAREAGRLMGLGEAACVELEVAGLLHDIGRVGVPSAVWDRPGPWSAADWERVRLHPYWTDRVLRRCPGLSHLADLAAAHHEHLDGTGYHRAARAGELNAAQRVLAAADAFAELVEPRPDRPAHRQPEAAQLLERHSRGGRLDGDACAAVIEAAGLPRRPPVYPADLSAREVDVLRLAARGLSNKQIAAELVLSDRTVGNHLARVYDKIGYRTRAGAAVFAIEHGLLPAGPDRD